MKHTFFCFLFFICASIFLQAQDKVAIRNGRTIEVKVHRTDATKIYYTYPGETDVYERPKSVISYIIYADGRKEYFDDDQRPATNNVANRGSATTIARTTQPSNRNTQLEEDIYWQDVKTTFTETEVKGMTRLNRISAKSNVSYRDAMQQLKKKAAEMGGTIILVMDIPENEDIEVMGIAYRDEKINAQARTANDRNTASAESSSNVRRRQIAQQMENYNNESDLEFDDYSRNARNVPATTRPATTQSRNNAQSRQQNDEPDAVYLLNGRIVKGIIEEFEPDDFVSIRTANGRIYEFSVDEVKRLSQGSSQNNRQSIAAARNTRSSSNRNSSLRSDDDYSYYDRNSRALSGRNNDDYYDDYGAGGYKGTFDVGFNVAIIGAAEKGTIEINTSHGYQFNDYLFAGAGIGLHIFNARNASMKNENLYPHYLPTYENDFSVYIHAVDSFFTSLPIFLDLRGYLPLKNSDLTPFAMFRLGYAFNLSDGFGSMGLYVNPAIGAKYQISPKFGLNFSIGYTYQSYGGTPEPTNKTKPQDVKYGYLYIDSSENTRWAKGANGFSLKLGIEF